MASKRHKRRRIEASTAHGEELRIRMVPTTTDDQTPAPPRRRFRLTIRAAMLAMPIIALMVILAAGINPFRRDPARFIPDLIPRYPYAVVLDGMGKWCSLADDPFAAEEQVDWSLPELPRVVVKPATPSMACLIKVAYVRLPEGMGRNPGCDVNYQSVAVDGRSEVTHDLFNWAVQGSHRTIPSGELPALQGLIAKLPPSQVPIPEGKTLLVAFARDGDWETRTYDVDRLPPEISEMMAKNWVMRCR